MNKDVPNPIIGFFGAAPDTSNMGVSALFASVVDGISNHIPEARFSIFDNGRGLRRISTKLTEEKTIEMKHIGIRAGRRYYRPENMSTISVLSRLGGLGAYFNSVISELDKCDVVIDISAGDSFSDIYGTKRFIVVTKPKIISLQRRIPLILLPQTYGPYYDPKLKKLAKTAVLGADMCWARDVHSFEKLKLLLEDNFDPKKHQSGVDCAFGLATLSAKSKNGRALNAILEAENRDQPVVGLNINGLIYNDPVASVNQFGFKADYRAVIHQFVDWLLKETGAVVVIVPHVMSELSSYESDPRASENVVARFNGEYQERLFVSPSTLDHNEVKGNISKMDWFCGTRMHSTIAALSNAVPTATIAYSDKTKGVFESCGQGGEVFDPRVLDTNEILDAMKSSFQNRNLAKQSLIASLPEVKNVLGEQFSAISKRIIDLSKQPSKL